MSNITNEFDIANKVTLSCGDCIKGLKDIPDGK